MERETYFEMLSNNDNWFVYVNKPINIIQMKPRRHQIEGWEEVHVESWIYSNANLDRA